MTMENDTVADQQIVIGMRAMETIVAAALLAFGLLVAVSSYKLGANWADDGPQAGYFPFYVGSLVALSSLVTLIQALAGRTPGASGGFVERGQLRLVMAVLLPALVYALGIHLFGIYLASTVYMTVFMMWLGKYDWWKAVIVSVGVSVLLYMAFEIWFQVPLHKGTLYNPLSLFGL